MDSVLQFFLSVSSVVGVAIVVATLIDVTLTVLAVSSGAGPLTRLLSRSLGHVFRGVHSRLQDRRISRAAGPVTVLVIIHVWLVLVILGWSLVFGQEGSLLGEGGEALQPSLGRLHYAATVVLSGAGSFTPATPVWRFAEQLAALNGLAFVGIAVAYVLPIVGAVVHKRKLAVTLAALGSRPEDILVAAWNGRGFGDLGLHLIAVTPEIALVSQRHLAYPVIASFHGTRRDTALAPGLVVLDEAVTLVRDVVDPDHGVDAMALRPCRAALTTFLREVRAIGVPQSSDRQVPSPDLGRLRAAGIPLRAPEDIEAALHASAARRALLAAYLVHDGLAPEALYDGLDDRDDEVDLPIDPPRWGLGRPTPEPDVGGGDSSSG